MGSRLGLCPKIVLWMHTTVVVTILLHDKSKRAGCATKKQLNRTVTDTTTEMSRTVEIH